MFTLSSNLNYNPLAAWLIISCQKKTINYCFFKVQIIYSMLFFQTRFATERPARARLATSCAEERVAASAAGSPASTERSQRPKERSSRPRARTRCWWKKIERPKGFSSTSQKSTRSRRQLLILLRLILK